MTSSSARDVQHLLEHVAATLPAERPSWPGGYPDEVELALIDAVLSIRTRYGSISNGVRRRVKDYASTRLPVPANDLTTLAEIDADELGELLRTTQVTAGTPKSTAIVEAARNLVEVGVRESKDLNPASIPQKRAYCAVHGLGPVTWEYFLMLSHHPGVKADTWIVRFVEQAINRGVDSREASTLVKQAASELNLTPTELDYAIWHHMSGSRS